MKRLLLLGIVLLLATATPAAAWCPFIQICYNACTTNPTVTGPYAQCVAEQMDDCSTLYDTLLEGCRGRCVWEFCGFPAI